MTNNMKIGTLSLQISTPDPTQFVKDRERILTEVLHSHRPDLLVCAGYTLDAQTELNAIGSAVRNTKSVVVLECGGQPFSIRDGEQKKIGCQLFGKSEDLDGESCNEIRKKFVKQLADRKFQMGQYNCFAMHCGEINLLNGRIEVKYTDETIGREIDGCDFIVNPTHDRMGNAGTLIAKRRFLSRRIEQRNRCYVSASNWNTKKGQKPSRTLHTIFINGEPQPLEICSAQEKFQYRQIETKEFRH